MKIRIFAAVVVSAGAFAVTGSTALASGEYEPNDSFNTAAGPIMSGGPISATIETENDEDYYFFYLPQRTQLQYRLSETDDPDTYNYVTSDIYRQDPDGPYDYYADLGVTRAKRSRVQSLYLAASTTS